MDEREQLRSKHAFGSEANISLALQNGLIDAYDILFLAEGKIGWIDKNGNPVILEDKEQVIKVDTLPEVGKDDVVYICQSKMYIWNGVEYVLPSECEGVSDEKLADAVSEVKAYTDSKTGVMEKVRYEVVSKPEGTVVRYDDREIRILCAPDTKWVKQSVGATGDANNYYLGFRAYAPDNAATFKEGFDVVEDKVFDFSDDFAGIDEYGRKYSVIWLAAAHYDEATGAWTYYGDNSSASHYVGWTYVVEWYDEGGVLLDSDKIRINLSNGDCHYSVEPYFVANTLEAANAYTDEQIEKATAVVVEF